MTLTTPAKKDCLRESGSFAWVVVIALGLMSAGTTGTYSIIAGSFVAPVCEDLGFDYTSFSFYFTAILLGLALGLPLLSRFIPKVIGNHGIFALNSSLLPPAPQWRSTPRSGCSPSPPQ